MNRSKAKTSYTKLTSRQRMEILDYWSKNHYPYSVICNYFSEKWHQEVKKTTVGDLILQWKRKNYIRGVNKVDSIDRTLHSCVKEIVQILEDQKLQVSDDIFYYICYGELLNRGLNAFSLTLDQIKQIVSLYYHPDVECFSRFYLLGGVEGRDAEKAVIIYDKDFNIVCERKFKANVVSRMVPADDGFLTIPYDPMEADTFTIVKYKICRK